jgi:uncharacterized protein YndB with AHSA1/START domain
MANENEFVITREFNAPRELLFTVWTEAKHLEKWWGPAGMQVSIDKLELKPGGTFHYCMKTPDGHTMWGKFVYREITTPEKIVFVVSFSDAQEGYSRHPMSDTWPLEVLSTVIFTEQDGKTTLTMTGTPINATNEEIKTFVDNFAGMEQGWSGTMAQLDDYLAKL